MATVSAIVAAMATALDKLTWVDEVSTSDMQPAITVARCAALIVPFGQEGAMSVDSLDGATITVTTRINVEFWVKHEQGNAAVTMQIARDAGTLAMAQLMTDDGIGYVIARELPFLERIDPLFSQHAGVPWLVASLTVPIENEVSI